jgi:hypothetical protein
MSSETNPWLMMWVRPRATIRAIVDSDPKRLNVLLVSIAGIHVALDEFSGLQLGSSLSIPAIFALSVVVGPVVLLGLWYLMAILLKWTGGWIGGTASLVNIRSATAWSYVPYVLLALLWIPKLLVFGPDLFTGSLETFRGDLVQSAIYFALLLVQVVVSVWYVFIYCKALGEVQGFSAWKAFGNSLLAALVLIVPIIVIAFVVGLLANG